jgi:hypothetical protein
MRFGCAPRIIIVHEGPAKVGNEKRAPATLTEAIFKA